MDRDETVDTERDVSVCWRILISFLIRADEKVERGRRFEGTKGKRRFRWRVNCARLSRRDGNGFSRTTLSKDDYTLAKGVRRSDVFSRTSDLPLCSQIYHLLTLPRRRLLLRDTARPSIPSNFPRCFLRTFS